MKTGDLKRFIENGKVEWESAGNGVRRKILGYDEHLMLVVVEFSKGAVGFPHHHPHRQVSYVVSGAFEVEIGDQKRVLRAGDSFYVPSETVHGAVALEPGILIDTFTPMREDLVADNNN